MSSQTGSLPPAPRRLVQIAERDPRRALALARRSFATPASPWRMFTLGWALLLWERLDLAEAQLDLARRRFLAAGDEFGALHCAYGLLQIDQRRQTRPSLAAELGALAAQFEAAGDALTAARVRLDLARQLNVLRQPGAAGQVLRELEPRLAGGSRLDLARLQRVAAVTAYNQGDYARAAALLGAAEQLFRARHYGVEVAHCWMERANLALYQERFELARELFARAERRFLRAGLPLRRAFSLSGAGMAMLRQGEYDQALRQLQAARDRFRALGRSLDVAICTLSIGNIYYYIRRYDAALATYVRAEQGLAAAGASGLWLTARRNQAMIYRLQGRAAEAIDLLASLERQAAGLDLRAEVAEIWSAQAAALADLGLDDAAGERFALAGERFAQIGNRAAAAECALELGWLALRRGDQDRAEPLLAQAGPELRGQPHHAWRAAYGLGRCAEQRGDAAAALDHYLAASDIVVVLRRRLADEAASSGLYTLAADLYQDTVRLALRQLDPAGLLAVVEGQRALGLQRQISAPPHAPPLAEHAEHESLRGQISALLGQPAPATAALDAALDAYADLILRARHSQDQPAHREPIPAQTLSLPEVRAALEAAFNDQWTALIYLISGGTLHIITLTGADLTIEQTPLDAGLTRLIAQASQPEQRHYTYNDLPYIQGLTARPWERLLALGQRLLPAAARARLGPSHRLLIVPAGPLHSMPWAALRLDEGWLIERAIIHVLPALSAVPMLARRRPTGEAALLVGCGSFGERAAALPSVAAELDTVRERWPGPSRELRDAAATRAALLAAQAERPHDLALLHLASHARLVPDRGLAAHVRLWDGELLLPEVAGLRLAATMVVLSLCEGAAADVRPGEEVLSLSWAFLAAGACGVLASLWPVHDRQAHELMAALYKRLDERRDLALALALTQRALLARAPDGPASAPSVWGSFIVTGACGPPR